VAKILGDGKRERTRAFSELVSHYLFSDRFGRPGKGNDKGKVEGLVKYARRNFMTPKPQAASYDALNAAFWSAVMRGKANVLAAMPRPSVSAWLLTLRRYAHYRRCHWSHARGAAPVCHRRRWCGIAAMITRCPQGLGSRMWW
jgi:hypothetical protein